MARARNIKPSFFTNDDLVELPFETRLLFIGLWTLADREGRIVDRPKKIKMEIFPSDDVDCDASIRMLEERGFIERYTFGSHKVIEVMKFGKHQSPHSTERDSAMPSRDGFYTVNERNKSGGITGEFQHLTQEQLENNVKKPFSNVIPELDNALNPESGILNPESITLPAAKAPDRRSKPRGSEEDYAAARWLFGAILRVNQTAKPPNYDSWANDVRLLREVDGRTHREICELFQFAKNDAFWSPNIQSPAKLREKWDVLTERRMKAAPPPAEEKKKDWI